MLRNPDEQVIYVADRANFPYGGRDKDALREILVDLVHVLDAFFKPKAAALACNTASVSALDLLRGRFPGIFWVGTGPAVKPAVMASRKCSIGVLGTERTIDDPCIGELARRWGPDCKVTGIAAPDLVTFVEQGGDSAGLDEQRRHIEPYLDRIRAAGADAVVLGCTHFLFLREAFRAAAGEGIGIYDSVNGVITRVESLLDARTLRATARIVPMLEDLPPSGLKPPLSDETDRRNLLLLTGDAPPEERWRQRAGSAGLCLSLLRGF
jgi:glutamate racemase